jgi:hypothetical protein
MLYLLIALQLLDLATTYYAVEKQGKREANKLLAKLFDRIGVVPTLLLTKGAVIVGLLMVDLHEYVLLALIALYVAVIINNVKAIKS